MNGAPWYDGVGYLAQCPVKSGTNFTYRFQVRESGTRSHYALALLNSDLATGSCTSAK